MTKTCTTYSGYCAPTVEDHLITRAREYITDKYLDLADVPKFIKKLVELHDANERLSARIRELESEKSFDVSDVSCDYLAGTSPHSERL